LLDASIVAEIFAVPHRQSGAAGGAYAAPEHSERKAADHERRRECGVKEPGDAGAARGVGLWHVHGAGVQHAAEIEMVEAVIAGRDVHAGPIQP
jgi:hypothetical protein